MTDQPTTRGKRGKNLPRYHVLDGIKSATSSTGCYVLLSRLPDASTGQLPQPLPRGADSQRTKPCAYEANLKWFVSQGRYAI